MREALKKIVKRLPEVPPASDYRVEALTGGLTNQNFLIEINDEKYVASLHDEQSVLLGIDRDIEYHNSRLAFRHEIAPEVVLRLSGILVSRFVKGKVLQPGDLQRPKIRQRVIHTLRRCHQIQKEHVQGFFSVFRDVEHHIQISKKYDVTHDWIIRQMNRIERAFKEHSFSPVFCHNDTVPENMIDDGEQIVLIDWEYAGIGDPFFDLGMLARYHQLDEEQERALLDTYFGAHNKGTLARLRLMCIMSDLRDWSWALVQQENSSVDFDYVQYGEERFQRATVACSQPHFESWLQSAANTPRLPLPSSGGKNAQLF